MQNIYIYGVLTATGKGYEGGKSPLNENESGYQGKSYDGKPKQSQDRNFGGGGGGIGDPGSTGTNGRPGGGAGYGENG